MRQLIQRTAILGACLLMAAPTLADDNSDEAEFITRARRMTYEGRRAGEGYFSPDGSRMVFQSERIAENPFFQIYEMDLMMGDTELVSTGTGKTTCAFIQPGTGEVMFASTHLDPESEKLQAEEIAFRESGQERRYSWDYDPHFDLFVSEGDEFRRLTDAHGYDAEGSYSPDGQMIVFCSMRSMFEEDLTEEEEKLKEIDPSYFGEIYTINADGTGLKRLTNVRGYDGGPFFSADGSRIVWRRFDEKGFIADVYTMAPDGTDEIRVTDFGCMSWAPYFHPSGEYIIFASNKLGFANFELYIVDAAGEKEPVRVSYSEGFDGLPVFTPDGDQLSWTSTRYGGENGQLYMANWNHDAALKALEAAPARTNNSEVNE